MSSDITPVNITAQWREDWSSTTVVNLPIVTDLTIYHYCNQPY